MRALFLTLLLAGCDTPIPAERSAYIGQWGADNMVLDISAGGRLFYRRHEGGSNKQIDAPVQSFQGDDLVAGLWFIHTTFKVSQPPHQENGVWKMTVDGVELTRR